MGSGTPFKIGASLVQKVRLQQQVARPLCQRLDRIRVEASIRADRAGQTEFK
jgi:hypothetical protein